MLSFFRLIHFPSSDSPKRKGLFDSISIQYQIKKTFCSVLAENMKPREILHGGILVLQYKNSGISIKPRKSAEKEMVPIFTLIREFTLIGKKLHLNCAAFDLRCPRDWYLVE